MKPQPERFTSTQARDAALCLDWLAGDPPAALTKRYGLSSTRISQIISRAGLRHSLSERSKAREAREALAVTEWSSANPGRRLDEAVRELQIPRLRIRRLLGARLSLHQGAASSPPAPPRIQRHHRPKWTDQDLQCWLQRYFTETPPPWSLAALTPWLKTQDQAPSASLIRSRLGRWNTLITLGTTTDC